MEAIKLLILVFGLLFILERKPMNIIFNFIGIIISTAILLGHFDTDYLSYLLIIIYCSALTIIFGFVIMLTPSDHFERFYDHKFFLFLPLFILLSYNSLNTSDVLNNLDNLILLDGDWDLTFLNKIGYLLYFDDINIIRFFIATLILLLALVALFFILSPTFN